MKPPRLPLGVITCILSRHTREAVGLGRSLRLNSPEVPATCVVEGELTPDQRAELTACFDDVVPIESRHRRLGWLVKHEMIHYSPYRHTLFLDSDCVVLRDLRPAFAAAQGRAIAFTTKPIPEQETGDALYAGISLAYQLRRFNVDWWPQIVGGGHFFFEHTPEAARLFARATEWGRPENVAEFGWTDRSRIAPDELTLQLALVEAGLGRSCALLDLPLVCWTPWNDARPDVFGRRMSLRDRATGRRSWDSSFFVAHFGGNAENPNYARELSRLRVFHPTGPLPLALARPTTPLFHAAAHGRDLWRRAAGKFTSSR